MLSRDEFEVVGLEECMVGIEGDEEGELKSFVDEIVVVVVGFRRARLGGGHPATSSSELDEASIV